MLVGVLGTWIRGLLSIVMLAAGIWMIQEWFDELPNQARVLDSTGATYTERPLLTTGERLAAWQPEPNRSTGLLVGGVLLLLFTFGGRLLMSPWLWRKGGTPPTAAPRRSHAVKTRHGYALHVEEYGARNAPPLVLVHGAGCNRTEWREAVDDLGDRFRIFAFDLLGHGKSDHVADADHTLEAAAQDLDDVIELAGLDNLVLTGHSMGGMIAMVWCRRYPQRAAQIAGLVLVHTTPQNPFTTMSHPALQRALQKPLHEPLLHLTAAVPWLVRPMLWLEYLNGMTHWRNDFTLFGGTETREQLDRTARMFASMDPGAVARFCLSMAHYEVGPALPRFTMPTLVVSGDKDSTTVPGAARSIAARIPNARIVDLHNTRHMGFMERRDLFAEQVDSLRAEPDDEKTKRVAAR